VVQPDPIDDSGRLAHAVVAAGKRGASITGRLVAVLVVFAILVVTYANSLRVNFAQTHQLAATRAQVQAAQQTVNDLYDQLTRWQDPDYVKAQARARLGWAMPGDISFRVIGTDGQLVGGTTTPADDSLPLDGQSQAWWDRLASSIQAVDQASLIGDATPAAPAPPG